MSKNIFIVATVFLLSTACISAPEAFALENGGNSEGIIDSDATALSDFSEDEGEGIVDDGAVRPVLTFEELYAEGLASITNVDRLSALEALIASVDTQIPNWNIWKYVPFAIQQAIDGVCYDYYSDYEKLDYNPCDGSGSFQATLKDSVIAGLAGIDADKVYTDEFTNNPEVKKLKALSLPELLTKARENTLYTSDESFKASVDVMEMGYNDGIATLRESVATLTPETKDVGKLTAVQLADIIKEIPEYSVYYASAEHADYPYIHNLSYVYGEASWLASCGDFCADTKEDLEYIAHIYASLYAYAKLADPNFSVDLASIQRPTTPDTGIIIDSENSAAIVTICISVVAGLTTAAGAVITAKRYLYSPLKRR